MMGQPKRNGKCPVCKKRGTCGCQRKINAELKQAKAKNPQALPTTCTRVCDLRTGKPCGKVTRNGHCCCPLC